MFAFLFVCADLTNGISFCFRTNTVRGEAKRQAFNTERDRVPIQVARESLGLHLLRYSIPTAL